ncbi:MAG: hypothetical protein U0746_03105 [Gemmataceae bacterium]
MSPDPTQPDSVAAADEMVLQKRSELDAARERASALHPREHWLANRPDLVRLDDLIKDQPNRQSQLAQVQVEYRQAFESLLLETALVRPFEPPAEIEAEIARLHWLQEELRAVTDSHLASLLADARLAEIDRAVIAARLAANRNRWVPLHAATTRRAASTTAAASDSDWKQFVARVGEDLRQLERTLEEQRSSHDSLVRSDVDAELTAHRARITLAQAALREADASLAQRPTIDRHIDDMIEAFVAEQTQPQKSALEAALRECEAAKRDARHARDLQERDWWNAAGEHPIADLLGALRRVPDDFVATAMARLLSLPANAPDIHDAEVHRFLNKHQRSARRHNGFAPVIVAQIGRLVANEEYDEARAHLNTLPESNASAIAAVTQYLRYVTDNTFDAAGETAFQTLSPDDLFLGACYYDDGPALPILSRQSPRWDYSSVVRSLQGQDERRSRPLDSFKVRGLQPRVAELAFRDIFLRLHGAEAARMLRDLNADHVARLARPWSLDSRPTLPSADWEDGRGNRYDVKCNVFYRSSREKLGLRGFLIDVHHATDPRCIFPGFVITETADQGCRWVYIGNYQPTESVAGRTKGRVLPFCFRLPEAARFTPQAEVTDVEPGMHLLQCDALRVGWQLAARRHAPPKSRQPTGVEALLDKLVEACARTNATAPLEIVIWRSLTDITVEACSTQSRETIAAFLDCADRLLSSRAFPVRLPRIDGSPILSHWIDQVLRPVIEHWSLIVCPECGTAAAQGNQITVTDMRMTSEGTIHGRMSCRRCGGDAPGVTLLTHCHKCWHYPLVIGKNVMCRRCKGLVCNWLEPESKRPCGCCKTTCEGRPV